MKSSLPFLSTATSVLIVAAAGICTFGAQNTSSRGGSTAAPSPPPARPAPTNLKVLPKDLTGDQVNELMEQWKSGLGMNCNACHAEDREKVDADGRPLLNFADDSKPEKATARLMYTMTEEINQKYIARIDSSGVPVTCGTCHRGHLGPEPFAAPGNEARPKPQSPMQPSANPPQDGDNASC